MRAGRGGLIAVLAVVASLLAACRDDGEPARPANAVDVEMFDYGYRVDGALGAGQVTITTSNTGAEWHMAAFAKLRTGRTVDEVLELFRAQAAGALEDPEAATADLIEKGLGAPGHLLQPGRSQTLTVDNLDAGSYVMFCFLPTEGEGTPHYEKGMITAFDVGTVAVATAPPETDLTITLGDGVAPAGVPDELDAGEHTFEVVAAGSEPKDIIFSQLNQGQTLDSFSRYFYEEFLKPGGPAKGVAAFSPGKVLGSTFQIDAGRRVYMRVELTPGDIFVSSATIVEGQARNNLVTVKVE